MEWMWSGVEAATSVSRCGSVQRQQQAAAGRSPALLTAAAAAAAHLPRVVQAALQRRHLLRLLQPRRQAGAHLLQRGVAGHELLPQLHRVALHGAQLVHRARDLGGVRPAARGAGRGERRGVLAGALCGHATAVATAAAQHNSQPSSQPGPPADLRNLCLLLFRHLPQHLQHRIQHAAPPGQRAAVELAGAALRVAAASEASLLALAAGGCAAAVRQAAQAASTCAAQAPHPPTWLVVADS